MSIDAGPAIARLLQLASPALPVGAYSYSQGLEWAVEDGLVFDEKSARDWIGNLLIHSLTQLDAPVLVRLLGAFARRDLDHIDFWNRRLIASRETRELRDEDIHLGQALGKLLNGLGLAWSDFAPSERTCFAAPFGFAANRWKIPQRDAVAGYLWAWLENQVLSAIKLVPLGQLAGQRILFDLAERIPESVERAIGLEDHEIGAALPLFAIASSRHETQYTRLFRS